MQIITRQCTIRHTENWLTPRTPWEEIWQATDRLVQEGKILYAGSSNFAGWNIAQANEAAVRRNSLGIVSEQCLFNLYERRAEMEVIPAARAYGVGVLAWSPLHGGLLGGILGRKKNAQVRSASGRALDALKDEGVQKRIAAYERTCAEHSRNPAEVAIGWLLRQPGITSSVIGPRTVEHLTSPLAAVENPIDTQLCHAMNALFPGPGPSPEAFAW